MSPLTTISDPIPMQELATRIRRDSNIRFNWQFYRHNGFEISTTEDARTALAMIIEQPDLHQFLKDSFDEMYEPFFRIEPLHDHCLIKEDNDGMEELLARAAQNRLGAYSHSLDPASKSEKHKIKMLFGSIDYYQSFHATQGTWLLCEKCKDYTSHLFTNWFFGVAWDWYWIVNWPEKDLLWLGCMTDTD